MRKSKKLTVNFVLNPERPAPLTPSQRTELKTLAAMADEQIDYDEIPPLDYHLLGKAVRGGLYRPLKQQLTLRVDKDVIAWQKSKGTGYQSRINKILRQAMIREAKSHS